MRRFTKAVAVKRFALVAVVQDGDRKQFEVRVWKAEESTPKPVGPPLKYDNEGFEGGSAREVRRIAHGAANRLAAQLFQGLQANIAEGEASPFAVQHMSVEWADRLIEASAAEVKQAAAQALTMPDVEEPEPWPLTEAEEEALDAAAAAKAQGMSPSAQEAASRRRPS
jgi:hypothetical protein